MLGRSIASSKPIFLFSSTVVWDLENPEEFIVAVCFPTSIHQARKAFVYVTSFSYHRRVFTLQTSKTLISNCLRNTSVSFKGKRHGVVAALSVVTWVRHLVCSKRRGGNSSPLALVDLPLSPTNYGSVHSQLMRRGLCCLTKGLLPRGEAYVGPNKGNRAKGHLSSDDHGWYDRWFPRPMSISKDGIA